MDINSLIILLPLFGAAIIGILGFVSESFRKQEALIGGLGTLMVAVPFGLILMNFLGYHEHPVHFRIFDWIVSGTINVSFGYTLDELSLLMGLIVTGVGSLIHIYSIGYMHGDKGYYKFFLYLNLFIFAMLNLILGDNMAVMFLGWEGVGACSYFLIGFWYEDMAKAAAAQKAFVANRIGDFAMLAAMFLIFDYTGKATGNYSLNFSDILGLDWAADSAPTFWVALLVFIAATGKSAQIPLYVWLPDAMAGPTPVSALIHAATMVTSGIYLISRLGEIFIHAEGVMAFIGIMGALTALLAALIAIAQNDIKKVLAYSTVSQLGFMFMALGAGAFTTAIFHVMTHAFFKACLFLGSGSVIHAMDHTHAVEDGQDIRTMGNLKKYMPATHITFFVSTLAIAGIPLFSGFFSKDEILGKVFANGLMGGEFIYYLVWIIGAFTAALTAFYMTRVYFLTFRGKERFNAHGHDPHESPATMTIPLYVLGFLAVVGGFVGLPEVFDHGHLNWISHHWLGHHGTVTMEHTEDLGHVSAGIEWALILFSSLIAIGGVYFAWNFYTKHDLEGDTIIKNKLGKLYDWMGNKFYVDELYEFVLIKPFVRAGTDVIMVFDKYVLDGIVNGIGSLTLFLADVFKRIQTGYVGNYALMIVAGVMILLTYLFFF
ncbi:MAG: NADH-quinone oxidoreductase subunit L [Bacteroidia bacterium]|nr:NADH-quinone oxidoreductase subunit L [Bacteroidia bacterium]